MKKMSLLKSKICILGHDTSILGRYNSSGLCIACGRERQKLYYSINKKIWKDYYSKNKEKILESRRNHYRINPSCLRTSSWKSIGIKNEYGNPFSYNDYNRLFQIQGGRCAGCSTHQLELKKNLFVDHNHKTQFIRGLLCQQCNLALGAISDNISTLKKLVDYLEKKNVDENKVKGGIV